jgi:hypothetical protein
VTSQTDAANDALEPGAFTPRPVHEQRPAQAFACPPALAVALAVLALAAVSVAFGLGGLASGLRIAAGVIAVAALLVGPGFVVVQPNESRVLILSTTPAATRSRSPRLWSGV